jgi:hypothetical protein
MENNQLRLYVDGKLVKSQGFPGRAANSEKFSKPAGISMFDGVLDEIRISSSARYAGDFVPAPRHEPDAATVALYHCDEGTGTVLKDSSPNQHHGTITGGNWVHADGTPIAAVPAALSASPVVGTWQVQGEDALKVKWTATLVLRAGDPGASDLIGYFDWLGSDGTMGREHVSVSFNVSSRILTLIGRRVENSNGLIPSKYQVELSADGAKLLNGKWLEGGADGTWQATRSVAPAGAASGSAVNPDRRAAEWALAKGEFVTIREPGAQPRQIDAGGALPAGPLVVERVGFSNKRVPDAEFANLAGLAEVTDLCLGNTALTTPALLAIGPLPKLNALEVFGTKVDDAGLAYIADTWPNVTNLNLNGTLVTDLGLAHLARMKRLKYLRLRRTKITNAGLAHLEQLPELTDLELVQTPITDEAFAHLAKIGTLRILQVEQTGVTAAGIVAFKKVVPACGVFWDKPAQQP